MKYKDHYVGEGYPDLVVQLEDGKLIVELKAISGELGASEEQQLVNDKEWTHTLPEDFLRISAPGL